MAKAAKKLTVVPTESKSPLETLWRQFPQLKNSTVVGRVGWAVENIGGGVIRTFRLLSGDYVRIQSTAQGGDEAVSITTKEREILEGVWQALGRRASGEPTDDPHGIVFASHEYLVEVENALEEADLLWRI